MSTQWRFDGRGLRTYFAGAAVLVLGVLFAFTSLPRVAVALTVVGMCIGLFGMYLDRQDKRRSANQLDS